ncbi:ABC transporter permease subunit [Mobilitalea sibirica]|uniref:ABC transporter permease subunit n=1 Tax=Mobilitalea sibirica TaxID=1462919 RepID=A0A8J7KWY9_9FIRM|nr:ABC transporter permease subunit [Mobilitalea sibirica]MBH1941890.1 ABC transporter permease subunit [Mobilitalea sibirica]
MKKIINLKNNRFKILAVCFWFLLWEVGSRVVDQEILLASPTEVLLTLLELCREIDFWVTIFFSSKRIVTGFLLALCIGTFWAVLSYKSRLVYELVTPFIKVVKATPVASFIILALIWISSKNLSVLISFFMVVPVIFSNVLQGLNATDEKLLQMAKVYRLNNLKKIKAIYIPSILPYLISAVSVGMGLGFKAGIAAEVIGIPANSIGQRMYEAKLYLMTKELFAWSLVIILISILFEKAILIIIHTLYKEHIQKLRELNRK